MLEMKIKIEVPDLAAAICKLATAVTPQKNNAPTPDEPMNIALTPAAPVNPTPAPMPTSPVPVASQPVIASAAPVAPAPAVPVTAPTYTLDQIAKAGAALVDAGKMDALLELLAKFGVAAVTQLQPDQFGVFATELRALGARI